jgi:hypothetical protein
MGRFGSSQASVTAISMISRQRTAQPVGIGRHQDQVHVVWHQAPGPDLDRRAPAMCGEQVAIERIIIVAEKRARPTIAAPGDMVRVTRDDNAAETDHAAG